MRPQLGSELEGDLGTERLPVKLADGSVQSRGRLPRPISDSESNSEPNEATKEQISTVPKVEDVATGARFGRPAVAAVIRTKSRKARIQLAKEQLAGLCQDIVSDPENSVRLFHPLSHDEPVYLRQYIAWSSSKACRLCSALSYLPFRSRARPQ